MLQVTSLVLQVIWVLGTYWSRLPDLGVVDHGKPSKLLELKISRPGKFWERLVVLEIFVRHIYD